MLGVVKEKASIKHSKVAETRPVVNMYFDDHETKVRLNQLIELGTGRAMMHLKGLAI